MTESAAEPTPSGRFSAYDTVQLKFVGGVHDTKGAAREAAKDRGVKPGDIEVREV